MKRPARMPYRARTATGDSFDIDFPLHAETGSAMRVEQLVTAVLQTIARELAVGGETSNGDVLQALAMSMAIRARMIHADMASLDRLSKELLHDALEAAAAAERQAPPSGRA